MLPNSITGKMHNNGMMVMRQLTISFVFEDGSTVDSSSAINLVKSP